MRPTLSCSVLMLVLLAVGCGGGSQGTPPVGGPSFTGLVLDVGGGPADVRVTDLDCDGILDLVALCPGDSSVAVRRGRPSTVHSNPLFEDARHTLVPDGARDFCVADFDGDGRPDVAVITGDPDFDVVLLHDATTPAEVLFNPKEYSVTKASATRVAAGDLNGDGKPDLVLLDESTGDVSLLVNDPASPGTFLLPAVQQPSFGGACAELALGDLDDDGAPEVMTLTSGDGALSYLKYAPGGGVQKKWLPASFRVAQHLAVGDLDGDGRPDVVVSRSIPENSVEYLPLLQDPASPSGFRESPTLRSRGGTTAMRLADVDRDGRLDLVAAEADASGATMVQVYPGDPSEPSGMKKGTVKFFNETKGFGRALAVADLNGDGFPDFVVTDPRIDTVLLWLRDGVPPAPPTFVRGVQLDAPAGGAWSCVAAGDLDGDGRTDLVAGGPEGVTVLSQDPAVPGTFRPGQTTPVGVAVREVLSADVDRDGRLDVVFAGTGAAGDVVGVLWREHDAQGFDPPTLLPVASAGGVAVGDLNGDGLPDLVCAVRAHDAAMAAIQSTKRFFAPGFEVATDGPSVAVALADLDCDGRLDPAAVNADDTLSILRHAPGFPPPGPALFLLPQVLSFAGGVRVATGDVSGDGRPDLLVADSTGVTICASLTGADGSTNQWPGRLKLPVDVVSPADADFDLAVCDVDRDGRSDVVFCGADADAFRVFRDDPGAPDGFRVFVLPHVLESSGRRVAVGDVDGDGWADVVVLTGPLPGATGSHLVLWRQIAGAH